MKATRKTKNFTLRKKNICSEKDMYNFQSLNVLLSIIKNEKEFKVQIITLESLNIFVKFLDLHNIKYNTKDKEDGSLSLVLEHKEFTSKRILLFNNKRNNNFLQIIFKLENEEKLKILDRNMKKSSRIIVDAYPYKNVEELKNIRDNYELSIMDIMRNNFDYLESLILFTIVRCSRLDDIIKGIRTIDSKVDNPFMIICKLNSLIARNVLIRNKNTYKINISLGVLENICKRTDLDINKL